VPDVRFGSKLGHSAMSVLLPFSRT